MAIPARAACTAKVRPRLIANSERTPSCRVYPGAWPRQVEEGNKRRKSFPCIFPQKYRVDTICCFTYTLAVVFRRFWPGGEREVFAPRNAEKRNGVKKSGRNGAPAPQSRASLSAL